MRHNKKRNPALLYEFLVRHISKCLINGKQEEAQKALEISKKYFAKSGPLHEELTLFKSVLETDIKSRHSAQKLLQVVYDTARKTNARNLDVEKSKLIKEINYSFQDGNFYNYKIPSYTVYASLQTLLTEARNKKKVLNEVQRIQLEDVVCEYLVNEENDVSLPKLKPEYNNAVYQLVVERFHKKYTGKLSQDQRRLLVNYVDYMISNDEKRLKELLTKEVSNIKSKLRVVTDEKIRNDGDLMKKLSECYKKFISNELDEVSDETILEVLRYMQLVEEVES